MRPGTSTYDAPVVMPSNLDSTDVQALITAGRDTHKHLVVDKLERGILGTVHNRYLSGNVIHLQQVAATCTL